MALVRQILMQLEALVQVFSTVGLVSVYAEMTLNPADFSMVLFLELLLSFLVYLSSSLACRT
jgi:hypothetical protein